MTNLIPGLTEMAFYPPRGLSYEILPNESGYQYMQTFSSDNLPEKVIGVYIGWQELEVDGEKILYDVYMSKTIDKEFQRLYIQGKTGWKNYGRLQHYSCQILRGSKTADGRTVDYVRNTTECDMDGLRWYIRKYENSRDELGMMYYSKLKELFMIETDYWIGAGWSTFRRTSIVGGIGYYDYVVQFFDNGCAEGCSIENTLSNWGRDFCSGVRPVFYVKSEIPKQGKCSSEDVIEKCKLHVNSELADSTKQILTKLRLGTSEERKMASLIETLLDSFYGEYLEPREH